MGTAPRRVAFAKLGRKPRPDRAILAQEFEPVQIAVVGISARAAARVTDRFQVAFRVKKAPDILWTIPGCRRLREHRHIFLVNLERDYRVRTRRSRHGWRIKSQRLNTQTSRRKPLAGFASADGREQEQPSACNTGIFNFHGIAHLHTKHDGAGTDPVSFTTPWFGVGGSLDHNRACLLVMPGSPVEQDQQG